MKRIFLAPTSLLLLALAFFSGLFTPAQAQESIKLRSLLIEVWPEYDRAETLVIYRGELSPDTPLPTEVTFRLPGYIEEMHAIAVNKDGNLVDANPDSVKIRQEGEDTFLTFATPSLGIQFEYYDPVILTKQGDARQLAFEFIVPYETETLIVEVQEPFQASDFTVTPAPTGTFIGNDGLQYNNIQFTNLTPGELYSVTASYNRSINTLSVESITGGPVAADNTLGVTIPETPPEASSGFSLFDSGNLSIGYILIGAGIVLLLGTGVYWWWANSRARVEPSRRPPAATRGKREAAPHKKRRSAPPPAPVQPPSTAEPVSGYCYRCGAVLRPDANFCHKCGAERRRD